MTDRPTMRPPDHPLRSELNAEVHARPSESLSTPVRISYLALASPTEAREEEWAHVVEPSKAGGADVPYRPANHFSTDLGAFSLRWERHAEFTRYTFWAPSPGDIFATSALELVPARWVDRIPGRIVVAAHGGIVRQTEYVGGVDAASARWFEGNVLVGSSVGDGAAIALTDFRVRADGFSRFVIFDHTINC